MTTLQATSMDMYTLAANEPAPGSPAPAVQASPTPAVQTSPTPAVQTGPAPDNRFGIPWKKVLRLEVVLFSLVYLLAVGFLLFGGVAARLQDPGLFAWGRHLLSTERGLWMTAVLPVGGLAMLAAVYFARRGPWRWTVAALLVAVLAGAAFVTVGAIDFDSKSARRLVPGQRFKPNQRYVARRFGVRLPKDWRAQAAGRSAVLASSTAARPAAVPAKREISAATGRDVFLRVCASCHGLRGEGMPGSGKELRTNEFIATRDDAKLVEFLKVGRQPWDPENTTKVQMPARGGDPRVTDDDLRDVVAYVRDMQKQHQPAAAASANGAAASPSAVNGTPSQAPVSGEATAQSNPAAAAANANQTTSAGKSAASAALPADEPLPFIVPRTYLPDAPEGPRGIAPTYVAARVRPKWAIPTNAQSYFATFFTLTSLGGAHVLIALLIAVILLVAAMRRATTLVHRGLVAATATWWWATGCWGLVWWLLYT